LSATEIGCLFKILLAIAHAVSNIGTPTIRIGTINEVSVTFLNPRIAIIDIIYPKNIDPVSPRYIFAG
jgi:putative N-acetylmannosamine-6-phosphate epimerase